MTEPTDAELDELRQANSGAADLRDTLINIAREIEALKRECGMNPESPIAIQNGRYMALSYKVRALAAGQATAAQQGAAYAALPEPDCVMEDWRIGGVLVDYFTTDQMRAYVDADRAMRTAQPASAAAAAQEPVAVPRFNCWSTNEGDSWFDHPADSQAIYDCLGNNAKVGDEYELTAGWESVTARYRITEVVGDDEEYEVECISHPQENTAPPPSTTAQGYALDALRAALAALNEAATSLETIARLAGRTTHGTPPIETHMETPAEIRSYAAARALVARAAQEGN